MNVDDQAFARSLARLRPAPATLEPDVLLYQAGLAAGRAEAKDRERLFLRIAALALVAVGLAAGGGFYAGHRQGERAGYLAAVEPRGLEPVESKPLEIAPPSQTPVAVEQPETSSHEKAAVPQPPAPASDSRLAAAEPLLWQRILEPFAPRATRTIDGAFSTHSPLAIRTSAKQWEDLSDFRPPRERAPSRDAVEISYPDLPDLIEPPRQVPQTTNWLKAITGPWGLSGN
ncbi:hypothetical protein [Candidatus Laterigemmans baculatus]|uniref:hypothetical protein n=1 Tax=Candidatus Laterigemmans baculatus TaxID=2770505 RepID=UPI0013D9E688|nr:hypothetical protein [Candidatus Laterigemmans baculatus]